MKKFLKIALFTIILFLVGIIKVDASESITIESVELDEKSQYTTVNEDVSIEDNKIKSDLSFIDDNDYVIYKIIIKNNDDKDYKIDEIVDNNELEYLKLEYSYSDPVLKAKSEKEIFLKITYYSVIPYDTVLTRDYYFRVTDLIDISFKLSNYVNNPSTLDKISKQSFTIILCIVLLIGFIKLRKSKLLYVLVLGLLLIPITTNAEKETIINTTLENDTSVKVNFIKPSFKSGFGSQYTKVEFIKTDDFPDSAVDVSNVGNGSIKAWVEDNTLYVGSVYKIFIPDGNGYMFAFENAEELNFNNRVDTTFTTNMTHMFASASKLKKIDLTSFRTGNVTNMENMFRACYAAEEIDVSSFDTSKVTNFGSMFLAAKAIKKLDLSHFDTSKGQVFYAMFSECNGLEELIIDGFDLSKASSSISMFPYDDALKKISAKNLKAAPDMSYFFSISSSSNLESIDVTGWDLSNTINIGYMFKEAKKLYDFTGIDTWDTSNISNMDRLFYDTGYNARDKVINLDLSNWDVSNVMAFQYGFEDLGYNAKEVYLTINNWTNNKLTSFDSQFRFVGYNADYVEVNIDGMNFGALTKTDYAFDSIGGNADETVFNMSNVTMNSLTSLYYTFMSIGKSSTTVTVNLKNFDLPSLTGTPYTFEYIGLDSDYANITLENWDISNSPSTSYMFYYVAAGATEEFNLTLKNIDMSSVTNMNFMFYTAGQKAKKFNIVFEDVTAPNVATMDCFLNYAGNQSIDWTFEGLNDLDLSHVTSMARAFEGIVNNGGSLRDLGTLNIYGGNCYDLFDSDYNLKVTVNLYSNPTNYNYMFYKAATVEGSEVIVNYTEDVTNIDNIIATKGDDSNVIKGSLIEV